MDKRAKLVEVLAKELALQRSGCCCPACAASQNISAATLITLLERNGMRILAESQGLPENPHTIARFYSQGYRQAQKDMVEWRKVIEPQEGK